MVQRPWVASLRYRHGVRCGIAILLTLVTVLIVVFSGSGARADATPSASATEFAPAACAGVDPGALYGVCYRLPGGGLTFLGSYRDTATGLLFICLDYGLSSVMGPHSVVSPSASVPLYNQSGVAIDDALTRVLGYLISKYAPAGSSGSDVTDAALALITREVMKDGYFGTAINNVYQTAVMDTSYGVGASVLGRAQAIWTDARTHLGPYAAAISRVPTTVDVGQTFTATVSVHSAAGAPMTGYLVQVASKSSNLRIMSAPASTDAGGQTTLSVAVDAGSPSPGELSVDAVGLPGVYPQIALPPTGSLHGSALDQRGLVATASTSRASASVAITPRQPLTRSRPLVSTQISKRLEALGHPISDTVTVSGNHGVTVTGSYRIIGPVAPVEHACASADWKRGRVAAHGTFAVHGNRRGHSIARGIGRYVSTRPGCYSYSESLNATRVTMAVRWTRPGISSETTLVASAPARVVDPDHDRDNDLIDPDKGYAPHSPTYIHLAVPHVHTTYRYIPQRRHVTEHLRGKTGCPGGFAGFLCAIKTWIYTIVKTVVTWIKRAVTTITYTHKTAVAPVRHVQCYYVLIHPCRSRTKPRPLDRLIYQRPAPHHRAKPAAPTHCVFVYRRGCVLLGHIPHARYVGGNGRGYPKGGPNHSLGQEFGFAASWLWGNVVRPGGYAVTHPLTTAKAIVGSTVHDFTHCNVHYLMSGHCGAAAFDIANLFPVFAIGRIARSAKELRDLRLAEQAAKVARSEGTLPRLIVTRSQIEAKFKHAPDFGVIEARGSAGFTAYEKALRDFVHNSSTVRLEGTYRGQTAILNYDQSTHLVVVQTLQGQFLSGWKMSAAQLKNLVTRRSLGGS